MSLKIQLGQTYSDKKGGRVGPLVKTGLDEYPFRGRTRGGLNDGALMTYNDKGEYIHGGSPDDLDLAAHEAECKADRLNMAEDLLDRVYEYVDVLTEVGFPLSDALAIRDFLRLPAPFDPQDDAAQRADHDNKISREQ